MLEIVSSKGRFSLPPNYKAEFEHSFNLHDFEASRDLKSRSFKIPKNKEVLLIVEAFTPVDSTRDSAFSVDVELLLFGNVWSYGQLYFIDEGADFFEVGFTGELSKLLTEIEDKELQDFEWPDPNPTDIYSHAKTILANPNNYDYVFAPVDLPSLEGDFWWPAQINSVVFNADGTLDRYVEFWRHFDFEEFSDSKTYAFGEIMLFDGEYYRVTEAAGTNTGDSPTSAASKWVKVTSVTEANLKRYNPMVPFFYVFKIMELLSEKLQVKFSGDIFSDEELSRLVFFNTVCLNQMTENVPGTVTSSTFIRYAKHLPQMTVRKLLIEFCKWFNQRMDYFPIDNTLRFTLRDKALDSPIQDDLRYKVLRVETIFNEKRTYNLRYAYLQEDVNLASSGWQETLNGVDGETGSTDLVAEFSTLPMRYGYNEVDADWREFPGDTRMKDNYFADYWRPVSSLGLNADVPKQWLFFRGFHEYEYPPAGATTVPEIPLVSSNLDYVNLSGKDGYTAYWQGTGGLYATWWKRYLYALSLGRVLRVYALISGSSWNVQQLMDRQALWEYVCLIEKVELRTGADDHEVVAELQVLKL